MSSDNCVLAWDAASPLRLTFHRTARVGDHEDPSRQTVATAIEHSPPCSLTRWPPDGEEPTYLLALDCPAGRALAELDAFGIRAWTSAPTEEGIKLEIKVEGENVASPPLPRWEQKPAPAERWQDYFFLSSTGSEADEEWIHGIAVKKEPRLVRQFVVRNDGTGASIQNQVTGEVVPEKMGVVEIEATVAPRFSEIVSRPSTISSIASPSENSLAAVSRTVPAEPRPVSPVPTPAQMRTGPSSSSGEAPCRTTPTDARPPRATSSPPSPTLSDYLRMHRHSTGLPVLPPDAFSDESDASLDGPAHPSTVSLPESALHRTASPDEPFPPPPPVGKYHLFVRLDRSFTIRPDDGTVTVKDVAEPLRVDNVSSDMVPSFLKYLVVESLRRKLAIGSGATVTIDSNNDEPLAIDSFDLVYDGRILDNSHFLDYFHVYPGCTLNATYRASPGYPSSMERIIDYTRPFVAPGPSYALAAPVSDFHDTATFPAKLETPDPHDTLSFSTEPEIPDPRRGGPWRRRDSAEYEWVRKGEPRYDDKMLKTRYDDRMLKTRYEPCSRRRKARYEIDSRESKPMYEIDNRMPETRFEIDSRVWRAEYELYPRTTETAYEPDTGKLEILPGGLIAQPLSEDPGTYDWASREKSKLKVRIVNFEQFRSLTGQEPPEPPQLPGGARLPRRDARNPEGTDSLLASNAEHQFQHQTSGDEFGTSSIASGSRKSTFSGKSGTRKPNEGGAGVLQNLAILHPVSEKPGGKGATSPLSDGAPSRGMSNVTSNDTTGHTASTEGSSGGSRPKHPTSEGTTGKGEVGGSKERGGNGKAETTSGSCSCCTCM